MKVLEGVILTKSQKRRVGDIVNRYMRMKRKRRIKKLKQFFKLKNIKQVENPTNFGVQLSGRANVLHTLGQRFESVYPNDKCSRGVMVA